MIPIALYLAILIELAFVSWIDIKTKKISNYWSIFNILIYILLLFIYPNFYFFRWDTFLFSTVFLVIGFGLFLLNIMGGGDSKFLFSFFLIVPLALHEKFFSYILISTVITGVIFFFMNLITNFKKLVESLRQRNYQEVKTCFGSKFAFAPVILLAWLSLGWYLRNNFI
jgi:prepilin peptidase CpaA